MGVETGPRPHQDETSPSSLTNTTSALNMLATAATVCLLAGLSCVSGGWLGHQAFKFNRSLFEDVSQPCSRTGLHQVTLNRSNPTAFLKLDIRFKTMITYQTFDCIIKVRTEFSNKSKEFYNDNEDIALMMFDIKYGHQRKEDAAKLELIHIARLDQNMSRFFYQKKEFNMPQFVPSSLTGYVLYGFEEMAQWHAESNTSLSLHLKRWRSSNSIYLVFTQYRIVSPYHCDKGIEVDCSDNTAVFAHCFPSPMLPLLLDGLPFCDFHPLHSSDSNRTLCTSGVVNPGPHHHHFWLSAALLLVTLTGWLL